MQERVFPLFWDSIERLGRYVVQQFLYTGRVLALVYLTFRTAAVDQAQGFRTILSVISAQIYFTGWQALPLISMLALASGSLVIMQSSFQLGLFGNHELIGQLLVIVIVRELAPLLTALLVVARSGTAVASEVGNMKANREIEALEVMGINPLSYIVFPRLMGGMISVVCLAFYFVLIALLGGFLVTKFTHDLPFSFYTESLAAAVAQEDIFLFLLKNTFGGAIIFTVCCYQGMMVKQSPHEVPQVTTKAVVDSIIYVTVFNLGVSLWFYISQLSRMGGVL